MPARGHLTFRIPWAIVMPSDWGQKFWHAKTPGMGIVIWSTHCHNDLGMAVANSLAAVSRVLDR